MEMEERRRGRRSSNATTDDMKRTYVATQAARLFAEKGFSQTKTAEIAAASHISGEALSRLFPSKISVLAAAIETYRDGWFRRPIANELRLDTALENAFRIDLDPRMTHPLMAFLRCVISESLRSPEVDAVFRGYCTDGIRAALSGWLRCQHLAGRIVVYDTDAAAHMLVSMVFGFMALRSAGDSPPCDERVDYIRSCVGVFLQGIAAGGSPRRRQSV